MALFHVLKCIGYIELAAYFYRPIGTQWEMWPISHRPCGKYITGDVVDIS